HTHHAVPRPRRGGRRHPAAGRREHRGRRRRHPHAPAAAPRPARRPHGDAAALPPEQGHPPLSGGILRLVRAFAAIDRVLLVAVMALAVVSGLLLPAFTIATGFLAGALRNGDAAGGPLVAIAVLFTVQRLLDPLM